MVTFKNADDMCRYYRFSINSDKDAERVEKAWYIYVHGYKGDGKFGCIAEMLRAPSGSSKTTVSNPGKFDEYIKFRTASGAVIPVGCESKTNGGRIQTFETELSKAEYMTGRYVIYSMDVCNSCTGGLRRRVPAKVFPKQLFIEKLYELGAVKAINHKGKCTGYGIQVSSKKFYEWLSDWPILFDRDAVYCDDDFMGLE